MIHFKTVTRYIRRSPYQAISAGLIMGLTFFVITSFVVLTLVSIRLINYLESRPQLSIFFKDTAKETDIFKIKKQLEQTGKTVEASYVSKEEALKIYRKITEHDDPILQELVTPEILPASLDVQAKKPEYLVELASLVKKSTLVQNIVFQKEVIDAIASWTRGLRVLGVSVIITLVTVSIFVILTIIGIKITIRREEIEIMKLLGASNWFIRTPFLLEGAFYGIVGALAGWFITYGILLYTTPKISSFLGSISVSVLPLSPLALLSLLVVTVATAGFLGAFSSFLAVLRYLK